MVEINNTTKIRVNKNKIEFLVEKFIKVYKLNNFSLSIAFIGDQKMRTLNLLYRGKDKTTDVLSFNELNEVIINLKQIIRQAKKMNKSFESELHFILVHGLLHLVGFEDDSELDRLKMIALGEDFLRFL